MLEEEPAAVDGRGLEGVDEGRQGGGSPVAVHGRRPTSAAVLAADAKEDEDDEGSQSSTCDTEVRLSCGFCQVFSNQPITLSTWDEF